MSWVDQAENMVDYLGSTSVLSVSSHSAQVLSTDYGATWQPRVNVSKSLGLRGRHLGTAGAGE